MEHGVDLEAVAIIAGAAFLWGLVSGRLGRWSITEPIAFLVFGLVAANPPLSLIEVHPSSVTLRTVAEITLAFVLFGDAARVNVRELGHDAGVPARLLLIGLPLTIAAGLGVALGVLPGVGVAVAAVIAATVAPTDAALGAPIMSDEHIPARVRRILNVESGLNDGIATPIVTFFIAVAASEEHVAGAVGVGRVLLELAGGVAIGVAAGLLGGHLLQWAGRRGWASPAFRPIAVLGLALFCYAVAVNAGVNGFIAAFVGGLAFGSATRDTPAEAMELTHDAGAIGSIVVWFIFGGMLVHSLEHAGWHEVLYAVLSLTVIRMVPVALVLTGSRLDRATVGIIGWFGPRGLASIVFGLIAFDTLQPADAQRVISTVAVVVLLSVIAHGATAGPLSRWYGQRVARLQGDRPEHAPAKHLPVRTLVRHPRHPSS